MKVIFRWVQNCHHEPGFLSVYNRKTPITLFNIRKTPITRTKSFNDTRNQYRVRSWNIRFFHDYRGERKSYMGLTSWNYIWYFLTMYRWNWWFNFTLRTIPRKKICACIWFWYIILGYKKTRYDEFNLLLTNAFPFPVFIWVRACWKIS